MFNSAMASMTRFQQFSVCAKRFPNEPERPMMKTAFPGPEGIKHVANYGVTSCKEQIMFPVDLQASEGNYVADVDGNKMLDMLTSIACIGSGYNHPGLLEATKTDYMRHVLATRTGMGINPPMEYEGLLEKAFMDVAPAGMTRVCGAMCGTCSVEAAFKHAVIAYAQAKRGGMDVPPTAEELETTMLNQAPGSPAYSILSFKSGFHGRLLGALSATRTNPIHKLDIPSFDWPAAEPPRYRHPLAENVEYNRAQDQASLADVRAKIEEWKQKGSEVVSVIVEPIMSEGGDNALSAEFAQGLQDITKELGIYFIVDEVQTGVCLTGSMWAHEQWNLRESPDFVTFAKKMLSCGFYHNENTRMTTPYRHMNTFMGDPIRIALTAAQNDIIKEDKLAELAVETGAYLQDKLAALAVKHPQFIKAVRGKGTFLAFDCDTVELRNEVLAKLKAQGVHQGGCGVKTIRLRPTLYFEKKHADIYTEALDNAIEEVKKTSPYIFYGN